MKAKKQMPADKAGVLTRDEALRRAAVIQELMASSGYKWLVGELKLAKRAWGQELQNKKPVGEGAADIARAQGALKVLQSVIEYPKNTLASLTDFINTPGTRIANVPKMEDLDDDEDM